MTKSKGIVLLGLGPGDPDLLTCQANNWLNGLDEIYLRTRQHPTVAGFPKHLTIHSFDEIYDQSERFEEVYEKIVDKVIELGKRPQGVTYAVPGHPFVAEATCPEIMRRATRLNIPVRVIEGLSFLEPTYTALQIDPYPYISMVDALELVSLHTPTFPVDRPALIAQVYSREIASDVKLTLNAIYPDEHLVRLVHAAGTKDQVIEDLQLYEIDRSGAIGLLTTLYLPPLAQETSVEALMEIVAHLRAPDGCPWDREQTQDKMGSHLLEETYEAVSALEEYDMDGFREELGDVLMVILLSAQIASEDGNFNIAEVVQGICQKLIRRHPHVFGDVQVDDSAGVLRNWEKVKETERETQSNGKEQPPLGILDSLPKALPALMQAQEFQERAARVGFDWLAIDGVIEKLKEEWEEVLSAKNEEERAKELGDLLFATVNLIRWYKTDAETVLRGTNLRFRKRFTYIEQCARNQGHKLTELSFDEMETLWQEAKKLE